MRNIHFLDAFDFQLDFQLDIQILFNYYSSIMLVKTTSAKPTPTRCHTPSLTPFCNSAARNHETLARTFEPIPVNTCTGEWQINDECKCSVRKITATNHHGEEHQVKMRVRCLRKTSPSVPLPALNWSPRVALNFNVAFMRASLSYIKGLLFRSRLAPHVAPDGATLKLGGGGARDDGAARGTFFRRHRYGYH